MSDESVTAEAARTDPLAAETPARRRVLIVGPGMRFASGISTYTVRLANALVERHEVSVLLLRELLPRKLFPGRVRIGHYQSSLRFDERISVSEGLDWYIVPSIARVAAFVRRARPEVIIVPWWTGAAAHSEAIVALLNLAGSRARLILELHETLDGIEDSMPLLRKYSLAMKAVLGRMATSFVVHSQVEKEELLRGTKLHAGRVFAVPHGTYDHFGAPEVPLRKNEDSLTYLFFGLIRPYKGVELLLDAFHALPEEVAARSRLIIAGEIWDGGDELKRRAQAGRHAASIQILDRYLSDDEVARLFAGSDVAVFPYLRASQSGAVRVAMAHGLPVVASDTGGLGEACAEYEGAVMVPPADVTALTRALVSVRELAHRRYSDPFPWSRTVDAYETVFEKALTGR